MNISAYENSDNENRVFFWLRFNSWSIREAAMLMLDIDPDLKQWHQQDYFTTSVRLN